jgi:NADH:ubiquinone oxidoreductase subunit C
MSQVELRQNLKTRLTSVRDRVALQSKPKYSALFDEFLREHEFSLALQIVCDFLLESETSPPQLSVLNEIAVLHQLMNLDNECIRRLRTKAASTTEKF